MRNLHDVLADLDAASTYYQTLEIRLARLDEQQRAAREQLSKQADVVRALMHERDEAESVVRADGS
jgi:hypothetical protein